MPILYIATKTAYLYNNANKKNYSRSMVLIYGDRVWVESTPDFSSDDRIRAAFRGRDGYIKQSQLQSAKPLEIYFIDVGQGDSTFIITPSGRKILVDGGMNRRALGFLVWLYRLDDPSKTVDIDLMVLSHADGDHIDGLIPIVRHPQINVKRIIHSGIATFRGGIYDRSIGDLDAGKSFLLTLHDGISELNAGELSNTFCDWRQVIIDEQCRYGAVNKTTGIIDIGDSAVELEVLGPCCDTMPDGSDALRWFDSGNDKHSRTINGHSVVLRLKYSDVSILMTGDLNIKGAEFLLNFPEITSKMSAHILKAPHHGSHEFHTALMTAIRPQVTVVSSGDGPDHGHPRANFLAAVGRSSRSPVPLLFSTEIAATFIDEGDELPDSGSETMEDLDFSVSSANTIARKLFKQRLPGLINVRTDGKNIYAARRVNQGYWWEAYGPMAAAPHPTIFS